MALNDVKNKDEMTLYEKYSKYFNKAMVEIEKGILVFMKDSYKINDIAVKECKDWFYRNREKLFSQILDPHLKYFLIDKFTKGYFNPNEIKEEFFDNAFKAAKKKLIEDYIGHGFLPQVNLFLENGDEVIIEGVAYYTAYHQPNQILFKDLDIGIDNESDTYEKLYNEMINIYFNDITLETFIKIIKYKHLPAGIMPVKWNKNKADALRFADNFKFTLPQFNNCFYHMSGKFEDNNRPEDSKSRSALERILYKLNNSDLK